MSFNYLGSFSEAKKSGGPWESCENLAGDEFDPSETWLNALIITMVTRTDGKMEVMFNYDSSSLDSAVMKSWIEGIVACMAGLAQNLNSGAVGGYTPADFPNANQSQQSLDKIISAFSPSTHLRGDLSFSKLYRLTPLQEGMLFETSRDKAAYATQLVMTATTGFTPDAYERAWQKLITAHDILRACYIHEGIDHPVQAICKEVRFSVQVREDGENEARIIADDAAKGFTLAQAPLMRATCIKISEDEWRVVWCFHHLILDGWSFGTVFKDLFEAYGSESPIPGPNADFENFIEYIYAQDVDMSEAFWKDMVSKVDAPTDLRLASPTDSTLSEFVTLTDMVNVPFADVERFAASVDVTISTILRAAWAILLATYSGENSVMFGYTTAGRTVDVVGVNEMVGMLINTLPVVVDVDFESSIEAFLKSIQLDTERMAEHEQISLTRIQQLSSIPAGTPMFHTLQAYENFPMDASATDGVSGPFKFRDVHGVEQVSALPDCCWLPG